MATKLIKSQATVWTPAGRITHGCEPAGPVEPKQIILPDNGSPKRKGGLSDFGFQEQVNRLTQPYIPGHCVLEMPTMATLQGEIDTISATSGARAGTRIIPLQEIHTFTPETPALIAGCLFDPVEVTHNDIQRFRFVGKYPTYVHLTGSIHVHKKINTTPSGDQVISDATLRWNPSGPGTAQLPLEARGNSSGRLTLAVAGPTLSNAGNQPYNAIGGGIEFRDPFRRWRDVDEAEIKGASVPIEYMPDKAVSLDKIIDQAGSITVRFDASGMAGGQMLRVLVPAKISSRFRVMFTDENGEALPRDARQYFNKTSNYRVLRVPQPGAKWGYINFRRASDTATLIDLALVASNVTQITFDPAYGRWGEYTFHVNRGITLYPGVVYCIDLSMGNRSGLAYGVFNNDHLRVMSGSLSFTFNAFPYLLDKGVFDESN